MTKNTLKALRTVIEIIVLGALVAWAGMLLFKKETPPEPEKSEWYRRNGFVALSYKGIIRKDSQEGISISAFDEQMKALHDLGFTTISLEDVENFYYHNKQLPERALLLMFEGGRKDSAIFTHPTLVKYGFKAVMFVESDLVAQNSRFFIGQSELQALAKNPFWEIGSMGYKLRYINHRPDDSYSFYLMEYYRDLDKNILEKKEDYAARVREDYSLAVDPLVSLLGVAPRAYLLVPANTLWESRDSFVQQTNLDLFKKYFKMAFTKEGSCYNSYKLTPWQLTRMQVKHDWTVNKLLREIQFWMPPEEGLNLIDNQTEDMWQVLSGAAYVDGKTLKLTSSAEKEAMASLKVSENWSNTEVSFVVDKEKWVPFHLFMRYQSPSQFLRISFFMQKITVQERTREGRLVTLYEGIWQPERPWPFKAVLRGQRLSMFIGGELVTAPLPVSAQINWGRVAFAVDSAPNPTEIAFGGLSVRETPLLLLSMDEQAYDGKLLKRPVVDYTGFIVPLSRHIEDTERTGWQRPVLSELFRALSRGENIYALLPDGSTDVELMNLRWSALPASAPQIQWCGVIFRPGLKGDLKELAKAVEKCAADGMISGILLDAASARRMIEEEQYISARWILLDQRAQPLTDEQRSFFLRNYGDVNVLTSQEVVEKGGVEYKRYALEEKMGGQK